MKTNEESDPKKIESNIIWKAKKRKIMSTLYTVNVAVDDYDALVRKKRKRKPKNRHLFEILAANVFEEYNIFSI